MSSTRSKSTYNVKEIDHTIAIDFNEPADYVMVDINPRSVFISFTFNDKPVDEMVTLKLNNDIDTKKSNYSFDRAGDRLLHLKLIKSNESETMGDLTSEHKFFEKRNHPKADPRGYSVQKPKTKNWDKIVATLDESDEEPDANTALKKIYDGCDDDTKRAMEKSLYESNGTVLNMNWGEVGKGKVEPYKSIDPDKFEGFKH